jgi:hypothetical protein
VLKASWRMAWLVVPAMLAGGIAARASAQAVDPGVGTWKMNLAKSKLAPGDRAAGLKSSMVKIDAVGKAFKVTIESVDAAGKTSTWGYTTEPNGPDGPASGSQAVDAVSSTGAPSSGTVTYKKAGKVVSTFAIQVSPDEKTLIITVKVSDPQGKEVTSVIVYDKQ